MLDANVDAFLSQLCNETVLLLNNETVLSLNNETVLLFNYYRQGIDIRILHITPVAPRRSVLTIAPDDTSDYSN